MEKMEKETIGLIQLIEKAGVFPDLPGTVPAEVLSSLIAIMPLPESLNRGALLQAVLEREALMSTAVGYGIALPHPRNPIIASPHDQCAAVGYLRRPVDWKALDRRPVHTVLLIVSSSAKAHLHTLSSITFFCQQESFRELLQNRAPQQQIIDAIREAEKAWR